MLNWKASSTKFTPLGWELLSRGERIPGTKPSQCLCGFSLLYFFLILFFVISEADTSCRRLGAIHLPPWSFSGAPAFETVEKYQLQTHSLCPQNCFEIQLNGAMSEPQREFLHTMARVSLDISRAQGQPHLLREFYSRASPPSQGRNFSSNPI